MSAASLSLRLRTNAKARDRLECQRLVRVTELLRRSVVSDNYPQMAGFDWTCPHCGAWVLLKVHHKLKSPNIVYDWFYYCICECPRKNCLGVVFVKFDTMNDRIVQAFPYSGTTEEGFPDSIPLRIREDLAEGVRAFSADCYKAVVVVCRRALQRIALAKGIERAEIKVQIKRMYEKGLITKALSDAAQEIRHFGGFGAHPQEDRLDDTTEDDARKVWSQLDQLVRAIYVMPAETAALAKRRQGIHQKPKKS